MKGTRMSENDENEEMSKLGVDEGVNQEDLEKAASDGCPECGATVEKHGSILVCPNHGTKPFE